LNPHGNTGSHTKTGPPANIKKAGVSQLLVEYLQTGFKYSQKPPPFFIKFAKSTTIFQKVTNSLLPRISSKISQFLGDFGE
jgi:hypothetical protein